ncbi:hypothetical protein ACFQBQ_11725 [Granulicella cerasi]|uniref:Calcineurin-like phosphoesterase domain-containing protein n=1 Tax=Granulicella cerasi TaxID=741063 RepID=A0ABW1Z9S3_9BACT
MLIGRQLRLVASLCLVACGAGISGARAAAQTQPVLMLSDVHFDPFRDPAKFDALQKAPASEWASVLSKPAASAQIEEFQKLAKACPSRGIDSDWPLFKASLEQSRKRIASPAFITVTGDMMAHEFECRYAALGGKPAEYPAFAAKTVAFVALQIRAAYPKTPTYIALGNNDSGCGDYREDPDSAFLRADALALSPWRRATPIRSRTRPHAAAIGAWIFLRRSRTRAYWCCRTSSRVRISSLAAASPTATARPNRWRG